MNRYRRDKAADREQAQADETGQPPKIRVTDRRRISLNDETDRSGAGEASPSLKPSYVEELERRTQAAEQKLVEVQARFDQIRDQLQRETDETRQRLNRAADERAEREKINFITSLLPVVDNLQRAIEAGEQGGPPQSVLEGVRSTASNFEAALAAAGVQPIEAVGKPFDPQMHEAVDTIEVEPEKDGIVTAEYSRGYRIGDRLLLPARVQVGRAHAAKKAWE
ncbi:MAG TPA: nucleotide exchange factor GrpE [Pyrinomonadaceae bacterium]|jgi:molecular chaperone GrpE